LQKTFKKGRNLVEAVRGVDLRVETGEIFGFLGPNGAGKTTTMRMLTTLLHPSGGVATVVGYDLIRKQQLVRQNIGYVSQTGGADPNVTARENLILQSRLYGTHKSDAKVRAAELIKSLELDSFADRKVSTYSGGQRRRLDLAMGMVHTPQLLFLDEPTTGLDPQSRAHLWEEIRKLQAHGTTIFITTHYLEEADSLCDRLAIMDNGQVVVEGTPLALKRQVAGDVVTLGLDITNGALAKAEELLQTQAFVRELHQDKEVLRLYVDHGEVAMPGILRLLDGASIGIQTIAMTRPSLDDVFLRQTGRSLRETGN
jgi:ABC-2 type transport system ATP-binding protein